MYNVTTIGHGLGRASQTMALVWGLGGYGEERIYPVLVPKPEPCPQTFLISQYGEVNVEWQRWFQKIVDLESSLTEPYPQAEMIDQERYITSAWSRWFQQILDSDLAITEPYPQSAIVNVIGNVTTEWQVWFQQIFAAQ